MLLQRALIIGIDAYGGDDDLDGCVRDAKRLAALLGRHEDETKNFATLQLLGEMRQEPQVTKETLDDELDKLFGPGCDRALLHFSGHGLFTGIGGLHLNLQEEGPGARVTDILTRAGKSEIKDFVLILDCCDSSGAAEFALLAKDVAILPNGVTVLCGALKGQPAEEISKGGIFTNLVCDALEGEAADALGQVTAPSVYAYASSLLGARDQRPFFLANVPSFEPLRRCRGIGTQTLQRMHRLFSGPKALVELSKEWEPTEEPRNKDKEADFGVLQRCAQAGLVSPDGYEHMYDAAMDGGSCKLSPRGRHTWRLVKLGHF